VPNSAVNPVVDNSPLCVDFVATAGQTTGFTIDNTPPPGGRALTIGYWKNWASCSKSGGGQAPTLDRTLYAATAAGQTIYLGSPALLSLPGGATPNNAGTSCTYAVNLLNKSTKTNGTKKASDPLFNMVAQLLAVKLNLAAGAYSCGTVYTKIGLADALLVKYSFNGDGYTGKLSSADATLANSLATYFDNYNNDRAGVC
jgi:hypothetical protein